MFVFLNSFLCESFGVFLVDTALRFGLTLASHAVKTAQILSKSNTQKTEIYRIKVEHRKSGVKGGAREERKRQTERRGR